MVLPTIPSRVPITVPSRVPISALNTILRAVQDFVRILLLHSSKAGLHP
jgi:hypothetical protein